MLPKIFFGRLMSAEDIIVLKTLKSLKGESCVKPRLWKPSFGITALNDQEIREVSFFEGLAVSGNFDV